MAYPSIEDFLDNNPESMKRELENLLKRLGAKQKKLKESLKSGDIQGARESLDGLLAEMPPSESLYNAVKQSAGHYNVSAYLEEGFDCAFRAAMAAENITLRGDYPNYEVFPFMVRVNSKDGSLLINKKKTRSLRLKALAMEIKREQEHFFKSPFRSDEFLKDLAWAYDDLMEKKTLKQGGTPLKPQKIPIMDIYKALTPMRRWRREYTPQLFGFHIYRLQKEALEKPEVIIIREESGERRLVLGSVPIGSRGGITIVEESGRETAFGSISFTGDER